MYVFFSLSIFLLLIGNRELIEERDGSVYIATYTGQWRQITSLSTETPSQSLGGGRGNDGMNVDR